MQKKEIYICTYNSLVHSKYTQKKKKKQEKYEIKKHNI